ncbi:hypothetical protein C7999DRAFT_36376 [Corynascus novoguineensis]|uniref:C2H2-type domain-containing protein n=1 Tax=Corynascus novoguineensis TaxID=1126955 RepID=A0AAN7HIL4_9PEZI|nr:hypothetical protein C7999DRAFT_36376 [Corynascus novoguineensis]
MGLTTILRGFKIPVVLLDRHLENNRIKPTFGHAPIYDAPAWPGEATTPRIDEGSAYLRTRLGPDGADRRIFLPQRQGAGKSSHAYVAFAYIMVFGQRRLRLPGDLPDAPPRGAEEEGDDPASMVFLVVTDSREFPFRGPFMRESDRTCGECGEKFESWADCQIHRKEVHEANIWDGVPDDL